MRARLSLLILGIVAIALYATRLDHAPIYLAHDEVLNAVNGYAIATTGRDPNGRFFPLFIYITGNYWATPIVTYLMAIALKAGPVSEVTVRLVSVVIGLTSVALMYVLVREMFKRNGIALLAAALLLLTPAHFIHSRLAVDHLYPVPFVLGWLWCFRRFLDRGTLPTLFVGTMLLGIGAYTYLASLMLMPLYLVLTGVALLMSGHRAARTYVTAAAGLAIPFALLVPWYLAHPAHFTNQINMYSVYDANRLGPLQGLRELLSYSSLTARSAVYYDGFNPSMLFLSGGASVVNATGRAGVFLLPLAVFLPIGIYRAVMPPVVPFNVVLLLGFLSAPLGPTMVKEMMVNRMLVIIPFGVLLATIGIDALLRAPARWPRALAVALLALVPLQFAYFYRDYMGDYRRRTALWFERNIPALTHEVVIESGRQSVPAVYLSTQEIPWINSYWKFYMLKYRRADLIDRVVYFSPSEVDLQSVAVGAVVLSNAEGPLHDRLARSGLFEERAVITEEDGYRSFTVFARRP